VVSLLQAWPIPAAYRDDVPARVAVSLLHFMRIIVAASIVGQVAGEDRTTLSGIKSLLVFPMHSLVSYDVMAIRLRARMTMFIGVF
jgi:hypothetical protein